MLSLLPGRGGDGEEHVLAPQCCESHMVRAGFPSCRGQIRVCLIGWFDSWEFRVGSAGQGEAVPSRAGGAAPCLPCCANANPWDWGAQAMPKGRRGCVSWPRCRAGCRTLHHPHARVDEESCWGVQAHPHLLLSAPPVPSKDWAGQSRHSWGIEVGDNAVGRGLHTGGAHQRGIVGRTIPIVPYLPSAAPGG